MWCIGPYHSHFADKSLSTIKRAVLELKGHNLLVEQNINTIKDDKRVTWLTVGDS